MELAVTLGTRPATAAVQSDRAQAGVEQREAIAIASAAVSESDMVAGEIVDKTATPEERNGAAVWIVELTTTTQTATVVVDAESGEVLELAVK